ncbi:hypothetical protein D1816_02630 [Aquimarina sp. AD10]|uniref:hypothetical protein n=1 Tax=Aquimarina sp. AD10 TaxID=1714849 RepID=UPI000E4A3616|nr:hypothetical protein [Aquimarina sp. AD10]AXT59287.1 hypothetical protein D1816_02630 [Aquimarina sp. AD10]RKM95206.1 hypothetical protein D7033_17360 [Aquimarina sp. AD10]
MKKDLRNLTILNSKGQIVFYNLQDFIKSIIENDNCFICGASPDSKDFNDEHIIPNWLLKKHSLHKQFVTLPNGTKFRYGQYVVPCCVDCNSELGDVYETPISKLLSKPYEQMIKEIQQDTEIVKLLFKWLSLIYLKTHLKDRNLLSSQDRRKDLGYISDDYYWEDFHHIHCIARSHHTKADIDKRVYGTMFILPAIVHDSLGGFDYLDSQTGKTIMLQTGDISIIANLNDSCAGLTAFNEQMMKLNGSLSGFQLREIVAHMNFINLSLKERPVYRSLIGYDGKYKIVAEVPDEVILLDENERFTSPGQFLRYYVKDMIGDIENKEQILNEIENGKRNYLFDEDGNFIDHSTKKTNANKV